MVRHPMYLGYIISQAGMLLAGPTLANGAVILVCWALFVGRVIAEECILLRDVAYRELCAATRWRLLPGVY